MEFFQANIHLGEVFVQLIAFVIVFWTLKLLAWKPLLAALEARRAHIKHSLDEIEVSKKEIESLKTEYAAHLQKIEDEARSKIQEAVEEGRRIARDLQEKARVTLRREIANLAISATERVLGEKMTGAKQEEKVIDIIEELERNR